MMSLLYVILVVKEVIMMAQTLINIRIDEELKRSMEEVCQEQGGMNYIEKDNCNIYNFCCVLYSV